MRGRFLLFLFFISGQIFSQYYYLPSTTQGNPGGLNTDNEYPSGSGLDASWEVLLGGSNSTPVWSPIDTIPFTFDFNGAPVSTFKVSSTGVLTLAQVQRVFRLLPMLLFLIQEFQITRLWFGE